MKHWWLEEIWRWKRRGRDTEKLANNGSGASQGDDVLCGGSWGHLWFSVLLFLVYLWERERRWRLRIYREGKKGKVWVSVGLQRSNAFFKFLTVNYLYICPCLCYFSNVGPPTFLYYFLVIIFWIFFKKNFSLWVKEK